MSELKPEEIRDAVRENYAGIAKQKGGGGCCCNSTSCCSDDSQNSADDSLKIGYGEDELAAVPDGANMGLGCGNPHAIAALKPGEVVLDLGSGGGFDCFLAAQRVGPTGRVIGIDMTPEMISKARKSAEDNGFTNVEFYLGEIEAPPVADDTANVIISNCVINLSPEKPRVFHEAFRVLKTGGRLAISDVVATADIPDAVRNDLAMLSGCVSGASSVTEIEAMLRDAGFTEIKININESSREFIREWAPGQGVEAYVASAIIEAIKP